MLGEYQHFMRVWLTKPKQVSYTSGEWRCKLKELRTPQTQNLSPVTQDKRCPLNSKSTKNSRPIRAFGPMTLYALEAKPNEGRGNRSFASDESVNHLGLLGAASKEVMWLSAGAPKKITRNIAISTELQASPMEKPVAPCKQNEAGLETLPVQCDLVTTVPMQSIRLHVPFIAASSS